MTPEGNNLRAFALGSPHTIELPGDFRALGNGRKERTWSEAAANNKPADPVGDVNQPSNDFDFWHFFEQNCCVEILTPEHSASRTPLKTERVLVETCAWQRVQQINAGNAEAFTVFRPTDETRFISGCKVIFPTFVAPANDNTGWHPLDAA